MIKLQAYCEIFSGYSFRKPLEANANQGIGAIQLKDVDVSTGEIHYSNLSTTSDFNSSDKYYLQNHDILLIAKGNNNRAVLFEKRKYSFPVLPAGAFIILRPIQDYLDPLYLWWYLNLPESQELFKKSQVKTTVHNLSIDILRHFEIKIPTLSKQHLIGEIYLFRQEGLQIARQREEKWTILIDEKLKRSI